MKRFGFGGTALGSVWDSSSCIGSSIIAKQLNLITA